MAMTDLGHRPAPRAPFGAITIFRGSSVVLSGFDALRRAFNGSKTKADLSAFTPAEREDIGVRLSEVDAGTHNPVGRMAAWVIERRNRRQTVRALSALSPTQLDDIGLCRAQVDVYQSTGQFN